MKVREETIPTTDNGLWCDDKIEDQDNDNLYSIFLAGNRYDVKTESVDELDKTVIKIPVTYHDCSYGEDCIVAEGKIEIETTKEEAEVFIRISDTVRAAVEAKIDQMRRAWVADMNKKNEESKTRDRLKNTTWSFPGSNVRWYVYDVSRRSDNLFRKILVPMDANPALGLEDFPAGDVSLTVRPSLAIEIVDANDESVVSCLLPSPLSKFFDSYYGVDVMEKIYQYKSAKRDKKRYPSWPGANDNNPEYLKAVEEIKADIGKFPNAGKLTW